MSRRQSLLVAAHAAAVIVVARSAVAGAAPAPASQPAASLALPDAIRAALMQTAAQIAPITVRWTTRTRSMSDIEELARSINADAQRADRLVNEHRHYRVTFQGGKYRAKHQEEPREPLEVPPLHESAFDGRFMYGGTVAPPIDGQVQTSYLKYPLASQPPSADEGRYLSSDVLDEMGVRLPVRVKDMKAKAPVRSEILHMLDAGARLSGVEDDVELDGRRLVRVRILADDPERVLAQGVDLDALRKELAGATTEAEIQRALAEVARDRQLPQKRLFVFYLDPKLNFAVRRREEWWEPDVPLVRVDLDGHEKLDDRAVFVPRTIVSQSYSRKPVPRGQTAAPVQTRTMEVTHVNLDPRPDSTFALAYDTPGTIVSINDDNGRQTSYIVKDDSTLDDLSRRRRPRPR
jgi:hypothetical protein